MNSHKSKSIYLFFLLSFIGYSQGDQRARALLDQVSEVYASYDTMQMRFSYQLDNTSEGISQKEKGEILVAKDKYNLTILGIQQIFDGTYVYTIDDLNEEVIIQEQAALDTPLNPLDILIEQFTANQPLAPESFIFDKDKYANYYIDRY